MKITATSDGTEPGPRPDVTGIVQVHDNFLAPDQQKAVLALLKAPGWTFGAFSDPAPNASRYWYKHFAGYFKDGREQRSLGQIAAELRANAPLLADMWGAIIARLLPGHALTRCYANAFSYGAEGGLHYDSNIASHCTVIYYPHLAWHPNHGGETVFFNPAGDEILESVFPRPNRLIIFPGTVPHAARGLSRTCPELRMTLMFKTEGP